MTRHTWATGSDRLEHQPELQRLGGGELGRWLLACHLTPEHLAVAASMVDLRISWLRSGYGG